MPGNLQCLVGCCAFFWNQPIAESQPLVGAKLSRPPVVGFCPWELWICDHTWNSIGISTLAFLTPKWLPQMQFAFIGKLSKYNNGRLVILYLSIHQYFPYYEPQKHILYMNKHTHTYIYTYVLYSMDNQKNMKNKHNPLIFLSVCFCYFFPYRQTKKLINLFNWQFPHCSFRAWWP